MQNNKGLIKLSLISAFSVLCTLYSVLCLQCNAQETLTITTYYPSPEGSYNEIRANRMALGYARTDACWEATCPGGGVSIGNTASPPRNIDLIVNGAVGIGTTEPLQKLHVAGSAGSPATSGTTQNGIFRVHNIGNNPVLDFGNQISPNVVWWIQGSSVENLNIKYPIALNPNGGNVGIGTMDSGTIASWWNGAPTATISAATILNVYDNTAYARMAIQGNTYGANLDLVDLGGAVNEKWLNLMVDGGIGYFRSINDAGSAVVSNNILVMDLDNGNVGIGTTIPASRLQVKPNPAVDGSFHFRSQGGKVALFGGNDAGTTAQDLLINPVGSGNVGIGTTTPGTNKLYVNGNLYVNGTATITGAKSFEIDNPIKPGNKLVHACLEGPELAVFYRGEARLSNGKTKIKLPEYFESITRKKGRTVQLTPKGTKPYLLSYADIINGEFMVYGQKSDGEFSWEVKAIRSDVEPLKVDRKPLP